MSEPFLGQVMMFAGNFAIRNWAYCDGALLPISQNSALFSILGTTYGGDGRTTFGLPDLRGRVPRGFGNGPGLSNVPLGQWSGSETVVLNESQLPPHSHGMLGASEDAVSSNPAGRYCATTEGNVYHGTGDAPMGGTANTGGGQSISLMNPYLGITFLIALQGLFPSRN